MGDSQAPVTGYVLGRDDSFIVIMAPVMWLTIVKKVSSLQPQAQ
jgi:hypothetical protein